MMLAELFWDAVPAILVGLVMLFFNTKQDKRNKEADAKEEQKKKSDKAQLSLLLAAAKLSYACAMAMKNGHPNGEIEDGIEQYKEAIKDFKHLEREVFVENISERS